MLADPIRDHLEIWMTLNKHEAEAAARLTRAHLERTAAGLLEHLKGSSNFSSTDQISAVIIPSIRPTPGRAGGIDSQHQAGEINQQFFRLIFNP